MEVRDWFLAHSRWLLLIIVALLQEFAAEVTIAEGTRGRLLLGCRRRLGSTQEGLLVAVWIGMAEDWVLDVFGRR